MGANLKIAEKLGINEIDVIRNKSVLTISEICMEFGFTKFEVLRLHKEGLLPRMRGFDKPFKFYRKKVEKFLNEEVLG